jgi:iron complex transport system ATP-binding protein
VIDLEGVSVELGGRRVLDSVSLSVDRGDLVGLVGPNGAGKTTLLRCINGVLAPDEGTVRIDGRRVAGLSAREHARLVATVPQSTSVGFDFSVREVVAMGRTPHRSRFGRTTDADRERVERALERAEVTELADRPVGSVSGGERQRVLLARALAQDAPALALDEPTASLDINHQVRTFGLVRRLVEDGRTALAAIHDLDLAARFCDGLAVLSAGELLAAGPPESVLTEELIETAFGGRAAVGEHPVTGSVSVTALEN